jgi:hypothetical protein
LIGEALGVAWLPWLLARGITLFALALAKYQVSHFHITDTKAVIESRAGLLGSDAGWYQAIAAHGYGAVPRSTLRFFPLLPLLDRWAHDAAGITVGAASLVIVNAASLLVALGLYLLVVADLGDRVLAQRAVWLITLAPAAFVFVMGYSDAVLVALALAVFYCVRRGHWWWAAAFGFLAGAARPIGCLLVVPAAVEAVRAWRVSRWSRWPARLAAVAGPVLGTVAYLSWVSATFGGFLTPLRIQEEGGHHGRLSDPVTTLYHAATGLAHGNHIGTGLHVPWVLAVAGLLLLSFWRLPASYSLFALSVVVLSVSGTNLDSFERYALSAFPLTIAASTLLRSWRVAAAAYVVCAAAMATYALLAFQGAYVP